MFYKYNRFLIRRLMCLFGIHHMQSFSGSGYGVWCVVCNKKRYCTGLECGTNIGMGTYIMEYEFHKVHKSILSRINEIIYKLDREA